MSWENDLSKINDGYLILNPSTSELVGIIEADEGRHDMQIALKMAQMGYAIFRLNFDDLVKGGRDFKTKYGIMKATQALMEGIE